MYLFATRRFIYTFSFGTFLFYLQGVRRLVLSSLRVDRMEHDEATKISRYSVACLMPPHFLELKFRSLTSISARLILSYSELFKIPCLKLVLLSN